MELSRFKFPGDIPEPFFIGILQHRYHQTTRGIDGDAEVIVFFQDDFRTIGRKGAVKGRKGLQGRGGRLDNKDQGAVGDLTLLQVAIQFFSEPLQFGDIGLIEMGHMGNGGPAPLQMRPGKFLYAPQGNLFNRPVFTEIFKAGAGRLSAPRRPAAAYLVRRVPPKRLPGESVPPARCR